MTRQDGLQNWIIITEMK